MLTTRVNGVQISWDKTSFVSDMVQDILNAVPVPVFKPYGRVKSFYGYTTAAHGRLPVIAYGASAIGPYAYAPYGYGKNKGFNLW